jgi:hypothetical protein
MDETKVEVLDINIGKYDVDSIIVILNGKLTEICFDKTVNVSQYKDKEVYLIKENGNYSINEIINQETTEIEEDK